MQFVARRLREEVFVGLEVHKGDQGRKGSDAADVDAPGLPIWSECKHGGTVGAANPYKALEQALEATDGRPVVAFCKVGSAQKKERYPCLMAVPLDFGLELLRAWAGEPKELAPAQPRVVRLVEPVELPAPLPPGGTWHGGRE